jgi:hypothetical protein
MCFLKLRQFALVIGLFYSMIDNVLGNEVVAISPDQWKITREFANSATFAVSFHAYFLDAPIEDLMNGVEDSRRSSVYWRSEILLSRYVPRGSTAAYAAFSVFGRRVLGVYALGRIRDAREPPTREQQFARSMQQVMAARYLENLLGFVEEFGRDHPVTLWFAGGDPGLIEFVVRDDWSTQLAIGTQEAFRSLAASASAQIKSIK